MKILVTAGAVLLLGLGSTRADVDVQEDRMAVAKQTLVLAQAPQAEPPADAEPAPEAPIAPVPPVSPPAPGSVGGGRKTRTQITTSRAGQESGAKPDPGVADPTTGLPAGNAFQPGMVDPTTGLPMVSPNPPAARATNPFGGGGSRAEGGAGKLRFQSLVDRLGQDGRSLVIRSGDVDPKSISTIEQDMNVMSHIIEKAAEKREGDEMRQAMGVRLSTFGEELKNMQIENYGVIFMVKVNFPLSGPPEKVAENKEEQRTNSTWEEAKRELYGPARALPGSGFQAVPGEQYNPKRVEELKESLVDALKNASNIRGLKEDDNVTVVVTGGGSSDFVYKRFMVRTSGFSTEPTEITHDEESKGVSRIKSTLTIKARKGDIDALAKGKMDEAAFKKKVAIALY